MKWINHLNKSINYTEAHLTDEIDLEKLSQLACCSTFHFQRMFSYIAEISLSEYIRRRRMSRAAFDLQNSSEKISDIAVIYIVIHNPDTKSIPFSVIISEYNLIVFHNNSKNFIILPFIF